MATAATGDPAPVVAGAAVAGVFGAGAASLEDGVGALFDRVARDRLDEQVQTQVRLLGASSRELKTGRSLAEKILSEHALTMAEWSHLDRDPVQAAQTVMDRAHSAGTCAPGAGSDIAQAAIEASYRAVVPYQELIAEELTRIRAGTDRQVELAEASLEVQRDSQKHLQVLRQMAEGGSSTLCQSGGPVESGIPPGRAEAYQRRDVVQGTIDRAWGEVRTQVVHGDGGVGKSQLAQACFTDTDVPVKMWVDASSLEGLVSGYAQAAVDLSRAGHLTSGLVDESNAATKARQLHQWLRTTATRWFLVLDDLNIPVDPSRSPSGDDLAAWWPDGPAGRTLVTTRLDDALYDRFFTAKVKLEVYEPHVALAYLEERLAELPPDHLDQAADLADELACHPLALSLAAAVVINDRLTITDYIAQLRRLNLKKSLGGRDGRAITKTWRLAVDRAATISRYAPAMAELVAYAHPTRTPRLVFLAEPSRTYLARWADHGAPRPVSSAKATKALSALHRLSLIGNPYGDWSPITVHALAQRAIRETCRGGSSAPVALADAAVTVWDQAPPSVTEGMVSTATALLVVAEPALITPAGAHEVLLRAGESLGDQGHSVEAIAYLADLLARLAFLGPDHPCTLTIRHDIAYWRAESGDLAAALAEFEQVHADRARVLGRDDHDTLTTRHEIARTRGRAGDAVGALAELEQVLADTVRVLGPDHVDTLTTRHNIAYYQVEVGDRAGGLARFRQVHADRARVLGHDHRDTLITRHSIAHLQAKSGDPAGALAELEQVLPRQVQTFGLGHPTTSRTRNSIAYRRAELGDVAGALADLEQLQADQQQYLGPTHRDTLITRHSIAYWRANSGDLAGALVELEEVYADQVRVLGPDDPDTLTTGRLREEVRRLAHDAGRSNRRRP